MNDGRTAIVILAVAGTVVVGEGVNYIVNAKKERDKRKKIKAHKDEMFAYIDASTKRAMKYLTTPEATYEGYIKLMNEELEFFNIIKNQPMY